MIFLMVKSEAFDPVRAEGAENLIPQIREMDCNHRMTANWCRCPVCSVNPTWRKDPVNLSIWLSVPGVLKMRPNWALFHFSVIVV